MASWFETRGVAALLIMEVLILRSAHLRASRRMKPSNWKMLQISKKVLDCPDFGYCAKLL